MTEPTLNTELTQLTDDVNDLEESLYEFHLRLRDMVKRNLYCGASPAQKMAGVLIEDMDLQLLELYRRAALMRSHLN
ncbi:hypothetical protein EGJ48_22485 [Pantoea dispersa]|uniref:hypothetical protein n=1 Tax=Pantoea dispersa TaxID=59814 RepID=UPI000F66E4D3|nr:hypothetical protein [Pantoea dispersa]RRW60994.1 hypothetical protein EGJ48_22485 [Pantoea dispersa]